MDEKLINRWRSGGFLVDVPDELINKVVELAEYVATQTLSRQPSYVPHSLEFHGCIFTVVKNLYVDYGYEDADNVYDEAIEWYLKEKMGVLDVTERLIGEFIPLFVNKLNLKKRCV